jgi:Domain of unknown function (DUF2382)/PRC-barrel domain
MTEVTEAYGFRGRTMIDRDGDKIGKIDDVYEARQGGQAEWALVNTGLFGTKKSFVPLHDAQPVGEDVRVPLEKSQVKDAPSVEADEELSESDERRLFTHYDVAYEADADDRREAGRVRLRKYVVTENEQRKVPVRREEVRLGTEEHTEQETISETLRKERVKTDDDAQA